jgi:DNA-binding NtrC family response regulator/tetratricopeptide (TPR) repeat protein
MTRPNDARKDSSGSTTVGDALALSPTEQLFREGRTREVVQLLRVASPSPDPRERSRQATLAGMAMFELGQVIEARFEATLALFSRESQFQSPEELLPSLSKLRQLASSAGTVTSLGQLHLVVARIEGIRGHCINARRHASAATALLSRLPKGGPTTQLVNAGLGMYAGNLQRSLRFAKDGLEAARHSGMAIPHVGCLANLGALYVAVGSKERAEHVLGTALQHSDGSTLVAFSVLDTLAQLKLCQNQLASTSDLLERCRNLLEKQTLPARSWYDLAHQVTRCTYFEQLGDWEAIVAVAEDADGELARRQYKAIRTSMLCVKARALARIGRHADAAAALAGAVRSCPRGAVDPLILLEASRALCAALKGDVTSGVVHYDRAIAACRAIGHRYHEWWISAQRDDVLAHTREAVAVTMPAQDLTQTSLLLSDVATILGAGHSVDLLAHRVSAILQNTTMADRVQVVNESGLEYRPEPAAEFESGADGGCTIRVMGSDRLAAITVSGSESIEEISLLKSISDLVQIAVARTRDTDREDEDLTLWPRSSSPVGEDTVFRSPRMVELVRIAERLAATALPVLLTGETGTGKEVFARLIHEASPQKRGPFVPFNCSAVARELVESHLFGHRRGAFTGAVDAIPGMIRSAEKGTLFLDELGDLDLSIQPKLLRFLESGEIQPVGDGRPQSVAVRVVAATNSSLESLAEQGRFRRDLIYRIGVVRIELPPLRERKDEIPALAAMFLARCAAECGRKGLRLGDDLIAALLLYDWPGNIRQLANEIRRVGAMAADGQTLVAADLTPEVTANWNARPTVPSRSAAPAVEVRLDQPLAQAVAELERKFVEHALSSSSGRVADAANLLGLSRKGLFLKRRRWGLVGN